MFACVRKCGVEAGGGVHPVRPAQVVGRRRRRWSRRRRRGVGGDGGRGSAAYVCPLPALSRRAAHCNKKKEREKACEEISRICSRRLPATAQQAAIGGDPVGALEWPTAPPTSAHRAAFILFSFSFFLFCNYEGGRKERNVESAGREKRQ